MRTPLRNESPGGRFAQVAVPTLFILGGLGMIYWASTQAGSIRGFGGIGLYVVAIGFILSGLYSFYADYRGRVAAEEGRRLLETHRDAPWRVRPQWRDGELVAPSPNDRSFLAFTLLWNIVTWPLALLLLSTSEDGPAWLVLIFPLVGLFMLGKVLVDYRRGAKFGRTTLVIDPSPARLGETFRGTLRTERGGDLGFEKGVLLKVSCYRQYVRRTRDSDGDRRRTVERDLLWRDEARIPVGSRVGGLDLPFTFELPFDQPPSNPLELDRRILWEVSAEADLPGPDLETAIEIPVFPPTSDMVRDRLAARHAERPGAALSTPMVDGGDEAADPEEEAGSVWPMVAPVTEGIELVERPDSLEIHFTAARTRNGALVLGIAGIITAALAVFLLAGTSFLWGVGLLALAGLLLYGTIQQATNDTALRIRDGMIEVTHDGIGMPPDVNLKVGNLEEVEVHLGAGSGTNRSYSISLIAATNEGLEEFEDQALRTADVLTRLGMSEDSPAIEAILEAADRPRVLVANQLRDKEEAEWLAHKIRQAVRREAEG